MNTIDVILSDTSFEFKLYVMRLKARIFFNEIFLNMAQINDKIIHDSNFWITGGALILAILIARSEKQKDEHNVEFG